MNYLQERKSAVVVAAAAADEREKFRSPEGRSHRVGREMVWLAGRGEGGGDGRFCVWEGLQILSCWMASSSQDPSFDFLQGCVGGCW